ncbi:cytosolic glutathione S-transferase 1 [Aphelenchoides avenae]|nr:cytosolic glutathione S-transferase 1 [Aphelenchus avenae]
MSIVCHFQDRLKRHLYDSVARENLSIIGDIGGNSKSGFLVDGGVTWADFVFAERLYSLEQRMPDALDPYPEIRKYTEKVYGLPSVKEYVASRPYSKA